MDALRIYATRYISIEENLKVKNREKAQSTTPALNTQTFKKKCVSKYENYTPLNVSRDFQEVFHLELVQLSQATPSPQFVDPTKRCIYHQNQGHNTKECNKVHDLTSLRL